MSQTRLTDDELQAISEPVIWPRFLLFPVLAFLGHLGLVQHWGGDAWWTRSAYIVFLGYCWFSLSGSFHEAAHQTLSPFRAATIWYGRFVGTLIGVSYTAYREAHIRHHAYMNWPADWEMWPYASPNRSKTFRRIFVWFDLLAGTIAAPLIYGRIYFSRKSPLKPDVRRTIFREYLAIAVFMAAVTGTLTALHVSGIRRFEIAWILPLVVAAFFNTLRKFTEHLGMGSLEPFMGARTVVGGNPITRLCSYFNFELFAHGTHHRYPRLAHHRLIETTATLQDQRPGEACPVFRSYLAALGDALPWIFTNPAVGVNVSGAKHHADLPDIADFPADGKGPPPPED